MSAPLPAILFFHGDDSMNDLATSLDKRLAWSDSGVTVRIWYPGINHDMRSCRIVMVQLLPVCRPVLVTMDGGTGRPKYGSKWKWSSRVKGCCPLFVLTRKIADKNGVKVGSVPSVALASSASIACCTSVSDLIRRLCMSSMAFSGAVVSVAVIVSRIPQSCWVRWSAARKYSRASLPCKG